MSKNKFFVVCAMHVVLDVVLALTIFLTWGARWRLSVSNAYQMAQAGVIEGVSSWLAYVQYFFVSWHGLKLLQWSALALFAWQVYWICVFIMTLKNGKRRKA